MRPSLCLGLMSGTSQDGVDAVLAEFGRGRLKRIFGHGSTRYPAPLRKRLLALADGSATATTAGIATLDSDVAQHFARAANALLKKTRVDPARIAAIGSHGQTVFHDPARARNSIQLGNPSLIAALTGITTVADFRRADIALGGQGAPLVPAFHLSQFGSKREDRVIANIGGIANVSVLPRRGNITGFDTGPGNGLMDEWVQHHRKQAYDRGGRWAAGGKVHAALLKALASDPWFRRRPPKSTGRDRFNLAWVRSRFRGLGRLDARDVQRTLLELTAETIAAAIERSAGSASRVFVCGGGARNSALMDALSARLSPRVVSSTDRLGLDPQLVEATAFAWLAMRRLAGQPGNIPSVTGAQRAAVLGGIYSA